MSTLTFETLGTVWWIEIFDDISENELETVRCRLELISFQFNDSYSRFLSDSLVSRLNRERRLEKPSGEFCDVLSYAKQLYLKSDGLFNVVSGHIQEARGYDTAYSFVARDTDSLPICNALTDLIISEGVITLTCGKVDLGGFGKGWLIDKLANNLKERDIQHFLINGGGDMYATSEVDGKPITIYLEHPTEPDTYVIETTLLNQGFAASSPFKRRWKSGDSIYTHIVAIDDVPEIATFVKARTAVEADAFATVAMLVSEAVLPTLAETESLAIARFDPLTNQFWQTGNFNTIY